MTIPTVAIEAATEPRITLRHRGGNGFQGPISAVLETHLAEGWTLENLDLTAALPALEQAIREQIAQELIAEASRLDQTKHLHDQDQNAAKAFIAGVRHAAQIARGKEQK